MAVTLTQIELSAAIRLGDSAEENAESARLLAFTIEAIARHLGDAYDAAPEAVVNEAAIRLAGYLFDQPNAGRGLSFANAGRNSGAWAILLPFRVHRAGSTGDAVAAAQEAVGTTSNPVINVAVVGADLVITFDDGTTRTDNLPAGMGGGADQTARDAAAAAQGAIDAHEASPHNTDQTARNAAATAQGTADGAQTTADAVRTELTTHETTPHGGGGGADQMARDAAAAAQVAADGAQSDLDAHELTLHNTDATARTAASAAQARADDAYTLADGKVDSSGAASAAREVTVDWAEAENPDPIPAPKLVNVVNAHADIVNVLDGRLPGLPVAMRLGWSQREDFIAADFARPSPPIGGSIAGMSDGLAAPPFPPGLASDPTLFLGIWLAGDPDVVEISGGVQFGDARPLTLEGGKVGGNPGVYLVSTARLRPLEGTIFSVTITGPRIVTESDLAAHASDPDAHHTPPAGGGGGPSVLYEASTAAIGTSTGLIPGNVACPETGALEFYFEGLTGTRQGAVAHARIPVARIRGAVSALNATYSNNSATLLAIPHGANRGVGVAVQATTNFLMLSAQAPGDFYIRVAHTV